MARITKIDSVAVTKTRKRVAAYARVSTDVEDQLLSLENQRAHYEKWIKSNPEWEYAGIYYDEGVTGTKKEKRRGLMQMISDCEHGLIDFVVTKSISRFSRNNADCLELTRKLLGLGIPIFFEKENINTERMESELLLSIMGSIAQAESTSISENCKWAVRHRYQNGTFKISYPPYGFTWDKENAVLLINEQEAETVRFIFDEMVAGKGTTAIADELQGRGVPTKRGAKWTDTAVRGIIKNEKYIGDCLFQKTYSDSSFNRHTNNGEYDQFYVNGHHDAIISKETYEKANALIEQHRAEKNINREGIPFSQMRYPLSGRIICGECGAHMRRKIRHDNKEIVYSCPNHIHDLAACSMKSIWNYRLEMAFVRMMNKLIFSRNKLLLSFCLTLECKQSCSVSEEAKHLDERIRELKERRDTMKQLFTQQLIEPGIYTRESNETTAEIGRLSAKREAITIEGDIDTELVKAARELFSYTEKNRMLTKYDADVLDRFVDTIVVRNREELEFHLKCGLNLTERM